MKIFQVLPFKVHEGHSHAGLHKLRHLPPGHSTPEYIETVMASELGAGCIQPQCLPVMLNLQFARQTSTTKEGLLEGIEGWSEGGRVEYQTISDSQNRRNMVI